jgi:hypothetical protein
MWYGLGLVTGRFPRAWVPAIRVGAAALIALGALSPLLMQYARMSSGAGFDRSVSYAVERSIALADFFQLQNWLLLWRESPLRQRPGYGAAFPGVVVLVLLVASAWWRAPRHLKASLLAVAGVCVILSLGPRLKVFNYPNSALESVPMPGAVLGLIPGIRMPSRLLPCAIIFLAVLAGGGASVLIARRPERRRLVAAMLVVAAALDAYPAPSFANGSVRLLPPLETSDAYSYIASTPDSTAIVELPAADSTGFRLPTQSAYVYGSVGHLRRVVSYNLSVKLPAPDSLQMLAGRLPDESARESLVRHGVGRLIVHRRFLEPDSAAVLFARLEAAGYPALFRGREATVYSLDRLASAGSVAGHAPPGGARR